MQVILHNIQMADASSTQRRWVPALLLVVFVMMQFFSVVHATEHPFHDAEVSCDSFHAIEKSKTTAADYSSYLTVSRFIENNVADREIEICSAILQCYQSRAPPLHS